MLVSLVIWLRVFFSIEEGPRARQMAERVTTAVSISRSALAYAPSGVRPSLMLDLATKESLRVQPLESTDRREAMPDSRYWQLVSAQIKERLGKNTYINWSVNDTPGIWVSFTLNDDPYWLVFEREELELTSGLEWLGWLASALLLALLGAAISVRFVNRPLARMVRVAQQMAHGQTPSPLPEKKGAAEIRDMNIAFNRMVRDIRQAEADRELMLAGISHDLRTPLARMRLEIEMSQISDDARHAIDEDLAQIDHSIGQLMEYARPASTAPDQGIDVSATIREVVDREQLHIQNQGGKLTATIESGLHARINAHDLKRIVINLIQNARRYGLHPETGQVAIHVTAATHGNSILIEVADSGSGISEQDITQLLRPFSRGDAARTGVSGAGLGLAIVERLLQHVGGRLELASNKPHGLAARIWLPRRRARQATADETT